MSENITDVFGDPEFQILYNPPSYNELNPETQGVYKFLWDDNNNVVAIAWTDMGTGAGILTTGTYSPVVDTARNFLSDMANVNFPAVNAYTLLDTKVATSDERTGLLQDAVDASQYVAENDEVPAEKEENLDD